MPPIVDVSERTVDSYPPYELKGVKRNIPLEELVQISPAEIRKNLNKISDEALTSLTEDQIRGLSLYEMSEHRIKALFASLNEVETKERLALFSDDVVVYAVQSWKLKGEPLKALTEGHVKRLKLDSLLKEQIDVIFCPKKNRERDLSIFRALEPGVIETLIKNGKLTTPYQLELQKGT
jgi:hypothetical protein